jgi:hypothetical protein
MFSSLDVRQGLSGSLRCTAEVYHPLGWPVYINFTSFFLTGGAEASTWARFQPFSCFVTDMFFAPTAVDDTMLVWNSAMQLSVFGAMTSVWPNLRGTQVSLG